MKATTVFWMGVIVICIFGVYQLKYTVRELKTEVVSLKTEVDKEYKAVHILEAEWAYLTRPDRLHKLAKKHFRAMKPLNGEQLLHPSAVAALPHAKSKNYSPLTSANHNNKKPKSPMLQNASGVYHE